MKNSTEQLLEIKSQKLRAVSTREPSRYRQVQSQDFVGYDYQNQYRTTYGDMYNKTPKLVNTFYVPKYAGFVPGMKSENPFGACFTKLAKKQITDFDNKRFGKETNVTYKE